MDDRDADLVRRIGAVTALEVRASGVHYAFAPCVAVSNHLYLCVCLYIHIYIIFSLSICLVSLVITS